MKKLIAFAFVFFVSSSLYAQQVAPTARQMISYQGIIQGMNGMPVRDSTYPIAVSFWTDATGGNRVWQDVFQTSVKGGVFNIQLGSGNPLPSPQAMDRPLWISVSFNGSEEALPRSPLSAVPTALNVADSSITTAKLADRSVTWNKMGTEYVPYIRVNGAKVNTGQNSINFTGGDGLRVDYDSNSMSVIIHTDSGVSSSIEGKGMHPMYVAPNGCGSNNAGPTANYNSVSGGCSNVIDSFAFYSSIAGGQNGTIHNSTSFIGSGKDNNIGRTEPGGSDSDDSNSAIVVGDSNDIEEGWGFIGGGHRDSIEGNSYYSSITSGAFNKLSFSAEYSSITGGMKNTVYSNLNSIVGGTNNKIDIETNNSFIGAGDSNYVQGQNQAIVAGHGNIDSGSSYIGGSFIGAGTGNTSNGDGNVIVGGDTNRVDATLSVIAGGAQNTVNGNYSAILGGRSLALGDSSVGFNGSKSNTITNLNAFSNVAYLGNVNLWLGNVDDNAASLRFYSPNTDYTYGGGSHYSSFQATLQPQGNIIYTLPDSMPLAGQFLKAASVGTSTVTLKWSTDTGSGGGGLAGWLLQGNALVPPPGNYLGTQDSEAFEIHVHNNTHDTTGGNQRVVQYSEGTTSPNILVGSNFDSITPGLSGAAILSGGSKLAPNIVSDTFSVIGGGRGNLIQGPLSVIAGGDSNYIYAAQADHNVIGGGYLNVEQNPSFGVIAGGAFHLLDTAAWGSAISGGTSDTVRYSLCYLGGGWKNRIGSGGYQPNYGNVLVGGGFNRLDGGGYSFLGGGDSNFAKWGYATLVGGHSDTTLSSYAFLGGGQGNKIDSNSDHSVLVGGSENTLRSGYSVLSGGFQNMIDINSPYAGVASGGQNYIVNGYGSIIAGGVDDTILSKMSIMGGGEGNKIDTGSAGSTIVSGAFNLIDTSAPLSFIGGGCNHRIVADSNGAIVGGCGNSVQGYTGFIGAGTENECNASAAVVAGGFHNVNEGFIGAIGGGQFDTIFSAGVMAAIPGGDHLRAASYAQTVLGFYNIAGGRVSDTSNAKLRPDDPLVIVGNGGNVGGKIVQSNAAEISYGGHLTVHDSLGDIPHNSTGGLRFDPIIGGTYKDNVINAWGDIPGDSDALSLSETYWAPNTFGLALAAHVTRTGVGVYMIQIQCFNSDGTNRTLTAAAITITVEQSDSEQCGYATCSRIAGNSFTVHTYFGAPPAGTCQAANREFFFSLVGR